MFERLDSRPDVLSDVLKTSRLASVLSARATLAAPWALHFGAFDRRAGFHVVVEGSCWVCLDDPGADSVELRPGDVVVFPHGSGHRLATAAWPRSQPVPEFAGLVAELSPGEQLAGGLGGNGGQTTVLCGSYGFAAASGVPLLQGLPAMIHLPAAETTDGPVGATVALLAAEADDSASGTGVVVDRLVDLLFVYALRAWLIRQGAPDTCGWIGALHDEIVGPALRAVHADPAFPWTVDALAQQAGLSRAAFARHFRAAVGEPPLSYLTRWRMVLADEHLGAGQRIATVAPLVGYKNEFAFAKAFKRVRGIAPGQVRARGVDQGIDRPA